MAPRACRDAGSSTTKKNHKGHRAPLWGSRDGGNRLGVKQARSPHRSKASSPPLQKESRWQLVYKTQWGSNKQKPDSFNGKPNPQGPPDLLI